MHALLFDVTKCLGCGSCMRACCEENGLPEPNDEDLCDHQFTVIKKAGGRGEQLNYRRLCMHCLEPACVSVCPVGALRKTSSGPVVYDAETCMGCRYCLQACPFSVLRYEWTSLAPRVRKCTFCVSRLASGRPNACAEACPTGATVSGERQALLKEAHARLEADPGKYVPKVYGEHDVGGTSVLVLSPVAFSALGLPEGLPGHPLPALTFAALQPVPAVVGLGGVLLAGLWWLTQRKAHVTRAEAAEERPGGGRP
jgi:formate dehydrogenase iron-sulfur subunit